MLCRWFFTVCSLMNIFSAISLFLKPCATSTTISRSRWLSGEFDEFSFSTGVLQLLESRQSVEAGHFQIEQKDVRLVLIQNFQNFLSIPGFGHHTEVFLQHQQFTKTIAKNRMVVRNHYPDQ